MPNSNTFQAANCPSPSRFLPWLLPLFVGSGCAALIYEIVWFQLLQLVIGSSAVSLGVLLGAFMGGMCLGSLLLARLVPAGWHPLRVFAGLELGIGVLAVFVLCALPGVARVYVAGAGHGLPSVLSRGVVAGVCLLPPTLLMGATLPAIARWVETTPKGVSWLGLFYGGNIAGAVFGCLLAGFYLLRVHDMATATFVAAAVNAVVALGALTLAARAPVPGPDREVLPESGTGAPGASWPVYVATGLSGLCALGAEVVWTRLLSLMLGPSVYAFAIILAVFLTGLGIGSGIGAVLAGSGARPRTALGVCQALLTAAIAWTAFMLAKSLPYWPIDVRLSPGPWFIFQLDLARCLWAVLPATILWGASFPLALAAVAARGQDAGRWVARVYAANTVGAIIGSVGCSVVMVAWVGTQQTQRVLIVLAALAALVVLAPGVWRSPAGASRQGSASKTAPDEPLTRPPATLSPSDGERDGVRGIPATGRSRFSLAALAGLAGVVVMAGLAAWRTPAIPWQLVAHGRYQPTFGDDRKLLYLGEGMNASVAVTEMKSGGIRNFHVSGKIEASTDPQDMALQRMLGHLPALFHPGPRSVLVVGCGAGVTAGTFVVHPTIEKITICEIEPLIPKCVAGYFDTENHHVLQDPRLTIVYDDARHFILTTREKFDIITSDPIHPWVKGAATLYTKEYFELVKQHLNPGGMVTQWVPLYESNPEAVQSEIATFFGAFPSGTIWGNEREGEGYDLVLLGSPGPMQIDIDALMERLRPGEPVAKSLLDVGFASVFSLLGTYGGRAADLGPWLKGAQINRDGNLRLQYLAGLGLNERLSGPIYDDILRYRKFPDGLFVTTSDVRRKSLRFLIEGKPKEK